MFDLDYLINTAKKLIEIPSPSGFAKDAMAAVESELKALGIEYEYTKKGALIAHVKGEDESVKKCITSHLDTLGAVVNKIKSSGRLELKPIGGYAFGTYEGEECSVHTMDDGIYTGTYLPNKASVHIYGDEARFEKREAKTMEVRLDEDVHSLADTKKLGIQIGDFVSFEPHFKYVNGFIKSRYLDDKLNCAALLTYLKWLKDEQKSPKTDLYLYFTNYEEIGHGISCLPAGIEEVIALDIGLATGDSADESKDVHGDEKKVAIAANDSSTPYDLDLRYRLMRLAKEIGVEYTVSNYPKYGSDATALIKRGADVLIACIGPAIDATHHKERTHIDGMKGVLALIAAYL